MNRILSCTMLMLTAGLGAQTTVKTILQNGNSTNRYDIVILGDGYQIGEQSKFDSDAKAVIDELFKREPYKSYEPYFNAHTVFRASKDSGADHPDKTPPIVKDTVYDASYNTGGTPRCLYIKNTSQALRDAALAPAVEGRVMVIVNDSRYGGCAGNFAVTYNGGSMTEVQIHEFGHSFAGLADEYDTPNGTYRGNEPREANVTTDSSGRRKWEKWIGSRGVSAYEGARYYKKGLWRPVINCIMRSLGRPACAVCGEQIVLSSYKTVSAIDDPVPAGASVSVDPGRTQVFSFTNLAPASSQATITWTVDNVTQSTTGTSLALDTTGMTFGNHTVEVEVKDNSSFVRNDPTDLLVSKHEWTLNIRLPLLPDLHAFFMPPTTPPTVAAGGTLRIDSWVRNAGRVASPVADLEHFLSLDKTLTTSDTYLGLDNLAAMNPFQALLHTRSGVTIPAHVPSGAYYVGVVLDRRDVVKEVYENNNIFWVPLTVAPASCVARLSFDDPLNYPPTSGKIVAATGGAVHPVVTARCHTGSSYLILLGCSGTTPGTPVPPNLNLPLNVDACTDFFYGGIGSTFMTGFLGTIDSQGHGRATLTVPSGIRGSIQGHFAAVVFDPRSGRFQAVTNPVSFEFR